MSVRKKLKRKKKPVKPKKRPKKRIRRKPAKKKVLKRKLRVKAKPGKAKPVADVPKALIEVNQDWCKGCLICIDLCPREVFVVSDKVNRLGFHPVKAQRPAQCVLCYECELHCPDLAITVEERK